MITANQITQTYLTATKNGPEDLEGRIRSLDVTQSYIVKAPAGSGKTELLSQRYLGLLSVVNEPEEILAITFTNKSGNEMRARIVSALQKANQCPEPTSHYEKLTWRLAKNALEQSARKGWDVLNNPNRLRIKTIDAFYGSLARRAPLSGLIGGGLQISDDYHVCYIKAAHEVLGELEKQTSWADSLDAILRHVDNRFDRAEELFVSLLEKREHWLPIVLGAKNATDLRANLENTLSVIVGEILTNVRNELEFVAPSLVSSLAFAANHIDGEKTKNLLPLKSCGEDGMLPDTSANQGEVWAAIADFLLTKDGAPRKSATAAIGFPAPSGVKDKELKALYSDRKTEFKAMLDSIALSTGCTEALKRLQSLPPSTYNDAEWSILQHLLTLLPVLAAKLLMVFERDGVMDHAQVGSSALRVLGDSEAPTDLALLLDSQLSHILIDEFQDTNNLQMHGLELITSGWEHSDGRTLFLVGDPMQSVYSFRGSNVGLFLDVVHNGVGNLKVNPIELTVNFRSQSNVVNWVNTTFEQVFPSEEGSNLGAIPYNRSTPFRDAIDSDIAVRINGFTGEPERARSGEGRWISKQIQDIRAHDDEQSIAVLVRNRSHLIDTVNSLKELSIPYQAIEIDPLEDKHTIRDLVSLTRSLCHLGDRTAWLSLLRSPMCGLTLGELELVARPAADCLIWETLNDAKIVCSLSKESQQRINHLVGVLRDSLRNKERKDLDILVEGAWLSLYGPSSMENKSDSHNAKAFFKILKDFSYSRFEISLFEQKIKRLYAKSVASDANPVQVMTLHKSKGLQFDHVFIPGCDRSTRPDEGKLLAWDRYTTSSGKELPILSASPEIGGGKNSLYQFITKQGSSRQALESDRIFYVGCTRAKNFLYLTGSLAINEAGETVDPAKRSFFGKLWGCAKNQVNIVAVDQNDNDTESFSENPTSPPARLAHSNASPELPEGNLLSKYRGRLSTNNQDLPDLAWRVDYASQVGTLIHRILRRICLDGVGTWNETSINSRMEGWRHQLLQLGVPSYLTPGILSKCKDTLLKLLNEPKAQWLLLKSHTQSDCELSVSVSDQGEVSTVSIDRTFVESGIRWVIDYKTAEPIEGEIAATFESRMTEQHAPQLEKYASIVAHLGSEPVKRALYLTATQSFVELDA